MNIIDLTANMPIAGSNGRRPLKSIEYAVIHHEGFPYEVGYKPLTRYAAEAKNHIAKGWNRIGYHFKIDDHGNVYQVNPLEEIAFHAGNYKYNLKGVGICVDGDCSKTPPTPPQVKSLLDLLHWLTTQRPDIPLLVKKTVKTHREVRLLPTACPSNAVQKIIESFRSV